MAHDDDITRTRADADDPQPGDRRKHIAAARAQADAIPRAVPLRRPDEDSSADIDPVTVPGYRLIRRISRGGQGAVYEASRSDTQRRVAIKLLKISANEQSAERTRFEREVQILRTLRDPRIVTIHEHGYLGTRAYFVMDYIEGPPLDEYLASQARPLRRVIELFVQICEAVDVAHALGVIHRDLKPANVLVDEEGRPYILDFGLARPVILRGNAGLTKAGEFVGSLLWASPEQVDADPAAVGVRTDVYSLGVMLYQTLTGQFPYALSAGVAQATHSIRSVDPIRPSDLHPELDQDLERIILRCLAKDPGARYASAGELAAELRRYLAGEPDTLLQRNGGWYVRPTAQRRDALVIVTAARRLAASLFGVTRTGASPVVLDATAPPPERAASAAMILLAASQLLAGILCLALVAIAVTARDPGDWVERGFDLLIVGAYIFFVPAALGWLLLRPFSFEHSDAAPRRRWGSVLAAIGVFAALATFTLFRGRQSFVDLIVVGLAIVPGAALVRLIERIMRQQGDWRLARQARWQFVGLLTFAISSLTLLGMRSSLHFSERYPHVLLTITALALCLGICLGITATWLLAGVYRVLHRAGKAP